jgi:uncharacterized phiE125 gp8 family phage protein
MSSWDSGWFEYRRLAIATPAITRPGWGLRRITDAATEPVSLADLKLHLSVTDSNEDPLITTLGIAARTHIEEETGRALITQTWRLAIDRFPRYTRGAYGQGLLPIRLPRPPFISINVTDPHTGLSYLDGNGATQQLIFNTDFVVDGNKEPAEVLPAFGKFWPATQRMPSAVTIDFDAGYGSAANVPAPFIAAIKMLVGHLYENRQTVLAGDGRWQAVEMPQAASWLVEPYRVIRFWEQ